MAQDTVYESSGWSQCCLIVPHMQTMDGRARRSEERLASERSANLLCRVLGTTHEHKPCGHGAKA